MSLALLIIPLRVLAVLAMLPALSVGVVFMALGSIVTNLGGEYEL